MKRENTRTTATNIIDHIWYQEFPVFDLIISWNKISNEISFCLATQANTAQIDSHLVVSKNETALKGTMVLLNSDAQSAQQSKDALAKTLTQQVQKDTQNSNSQVEMSDIVELDDGTLVLDYICSGVSDKDAAKKTLNEAVKKDEVKQVISNTAKPSATTQSQPKQPTTTKTSKTLKLASNAPKNNPLS